MSEQLEKFKYSVSQIHKSFDRRNVHVLEEVISFAEAIEQENEKLKADVARLLYYIDKASLHVRPTCTQLYDELQEAINATASSDAWLKERDAKVLESDHK